MEGTLKRSPWFPLIWSHSPTSPPASGTPTNHPTITFWYICRTTTVPPWVIQYRIFSWGTFLCNPHSVPETDSFAHLSKPLPPGRGVKFWALILRLWGALATFPFYVSDTFWWLLLTFNSHLCWEWNRNSLLRYISGEIVEKVIKLDSCVASITVTNPFTALSRKTFKSFIPDLVFPGKKD